MVVLQGSPKYRPEKHQPTANRMVPRLCLQIGLGKMNPATSDEMCREGAKEWGVGNTASFSIISSRSYQFTASAGVPRSFSRFWACSA